MIVRPALPLVLALLLPASAAADEKNPATEACVGKTEGAPCSAERIVQGDGGKAEKRNEPGSCQPDQCCTLDYASGPPPKSTCGPCLACKPGAAPATSAGDPSAATGVEPPRAEGGDPPPVAPAEKGCSVAANGEAESPTPWGWLLGLVFVATRRRGVSRRTPWRRPWSRR